MSWNQQKVDDLKKLWNEGVATSRIGEQLGFTKNAVIGKAFRLGLERRQNSRKKTAHSQSVSSVTMYRETSVPGHSQITPKREVTRRREKFSFKKEYCRHRKLQVMPMANRRPFRRGFSLLWWPKYSNKAILYRALQKSL